MDDIIYSYTWDDAIADGTFVNISGVAKDWGFKIPVAVTRTLWCDILENDEDGTAEHRNIIRLLRAVHKAIQASKEDTDLLTLDYEVNGSEMAVWAKIEGRSPARPEPIMTIMFPSDW